MGSLRLALLALAAFTLLAGSAHAAIPQGNLLANGGGETGTAVSDNFSHFCPQSWTCPPVTAPEHNNGTLARYGSLSGFPSAAESVRIGGGNNFFVGGPDAKFSRSSQVLDLSAAGPEIDAGAVQYTLGGCLGGKEADPDRASLTVDFPGSPTLAISGPTPAQRNNQTKLLPVSVTLAVPAGKRTATVALLMFRDNGIYNDASADNLSFSVGPIPGPAPAASPCLVPGGGSGGGSGGGAGGGAGDLTSGILAFADTAKVGSDGVARIRVTCNTVEVKRCKGTLSVSLAKASAGTAKKKAKLGTAIYSIASGKKRTVKVPLKKSDAETLAGLSKNDLAKRRLKVKTKTKVGKAKLKQTVRLKIKRGR